MKGMERFLGGFFLSLRLTCPLLTSSCSSPSLHPSCLDSGWEGGGAALVQRPGPAQRGGLPNPCDWGSGLRELPVLLGAAPPAQPSSGAMETL